MSIAWRSWELVTNRDASGRRSAARRGPVAAVERLERRDLLTLQVGAIQTTAGQVFNGQVATFQAADLPGATSYQATIYWAGALSQATAGSVVPDAANDGGFIVSGSNIFPSAKGSPFPLNVVVTGNNGTMVSSAVPPNLSGTANVADAPLTSVGRSVAPTLGIAFSGSVATFQSANPYATSANFSAKVNWGDGGNPVDGVVTSDGKGTFSVFAQHTYTQTGVFPVTTTVVSDGGTQTVAVGSATVTALPVTVYGNKITGTAGQPTNPSNPVAFFLDPNSGDSASDFQSVIAWGDGSTATVPVSSLGGGAYEVLDGHTYSTAGTYTVITQVVRLADGQTASGSGTAVISAATTPPPVLSGTGVLLVPRVGVALPPTTVVGSFTDTNTSAPASSFTAAITWGDGHVTAGNVVAVVVNNVQTGTFLVEGSNTYTNANTYPISVQVQDASNHSVTINSTAVVTGAELIPYSTLIPATVGKPLPPTTVVGKFTDSDVSAAAGSFTALITWGDGHVSTGTVVDGGTPGTFLVEGSNTYAAANSYPVAVKVTDALGDSVTINSTAAVTSAALTPFSALISASVGQALPLTTVVGSFTDSDTTVPASAFTAVINWGDGHTTTGTVNPVGVGTGVFTVTGTNTYNAVNTYVVSVQVSDSSGNSTTITSKAVVGGASLTPIPAVIAATAGAPLSAVLVGSFTDSNPLAAMGDFAALITWGDGHTSAGTVTGGSGLFKVFGSNTYAAPGSYAVVVKVTDTSGDSVTINSTAAVVGATLTPIPTQIGASVNVPLPPSTAVGSFTDSNPSAAASDFTAVITWGDGHVTPGVVTPGNGPGTFTIMGSNTYTAAGTYTVSVQVTDRVGDTTTIKSTATVLGATLTPIPAQIGASVNVPVPLGATVGSFTDSNISAVLGDFTAVITWGDGHVTPGVVSGANGFFTVAVPAAGPTNTYTAAGTYTVSVQVTDRVGDTTTIKSTATVLGATLTPIPAQIGASVNVPLVPSTVVGSFTDNNLSAAATSFTAVINWGDGHVTAGQIAPGNGPGTFTVMGSNTYIAAGTYPVSIQVTDAVGDTTTIKSTAIVTAVTLSASGTTFAFIPGQPLSNVVVAFVIDTNTSLLNPGQQLTAVINWGDSLSPTTTIGTVTPVGTGQPNSYVVQGSFTYPPAAAGTSFPVTVTITDPSGQTVTAHSTAVAGPAASGTNFTGRLDPTVDGPSSAFSIANTNRPVFIGTAPPFAIVQLFAQRVNIDANVPLGQAVANASGVWSLPTGPLEVGIYNVSAIVTPPGGAPSLPAPLTFDGVKPSGPFIVNTSHPTVEAVRRYATGLYQVFFSSGPGGMNGNAITNPSNYTFYGPQAQPVHPYRVSLESVAGLPAGTEAVLVAVPGGSRASNRLRELTVSAAGVTDTAGNPLPADYHGLLPTGVSHPAGTSHHVRVGHPAPRGPRRRR